MTKNPYAPPLEESVGDHSSRFSGVGYLASAAVGVGGWLLLGASERGGEGWDNPLYFSVLVPLVALLAGVLGFVFPRRPWRWGLIPYASQAILLFVRKPTGTFLPLGLIVFIVLAGACVIPAYTGALLRRFLARHRGKNGVDSNPKRNFD